MPNKTKVMVSEVIKPDGKKLKMNFNMETTGAIDLANWIDYCRNKGYEFNLLEC